jgi:O-antigen/teichoic acid export membrane protein
MVTNTYQGPNYTNLFHTDKIRELNKSIAINTRFMVLITTPIITVLAIFPAWFLKLFSDSYVHLDHVFRIMLIGSFVSLLCGSVGMLMQMTHQQKAYRNIMARALSFHVVLSILFSWLFGIIGLGISMTLVLIYWNVASALRLQDKHQVISYFKLKY